MRVTSKQAVAKRKHGINLLVYPVNRKEAGLVYVATSAGHFQEFYDKRSTFLYYVLEGKGNFFLNGKKNSVKAGDVIVAPPRTKIYYFGKLRMVLVTVPAWQPKNEVHVRYIDRAEAKKSKR